jgi:murein L,D-transpeptidase YcbB/YkuD
MRYLSDLNVGRANPRQLAFEVDDGYSKCYVARFLRQQVVLAHSISAVVNQVEPPYEGYRHTIEALQIYDKLVRKGETGPFVHPKKSVKPGDVCVDLPRLAQSLRRVGGSARESSLALFVYTISRPHRGSGEAVSAPARARHALELPRPSARVGTRTLAMDSAYVSTAAYRCKGVLAVGLR